MTIQSHDAHSRHRILLLVALALGLTMAGGGCTRIASPTAAEPASPILSETTGRAYAGLGLRDDAASGKTLVSFVYPGPLAGLGFTSPHIKRGDVLVAVNGMPVRAEEFRDLVQQARPGERLVLTIGRTEGLADQAVLTAERTIHEELVDLILADRADWTGPLDEPTPARQGPGIEDLAKRDIAPAKLQNYLLVANRTAGQGEAVEKLLRLFDDTRREKGGFHSLSRVEYVFQHPCRLADVCRLVTDPLDRLSIEPEAVFAVAAANLDLTAYPIIPPKADLSVPAPAMIAVAERITSARRHLDRAFAGIDSGARRAIPVALDAYLANLDLDKTDTPSFIRALRASMKVDFDALLAGSAELTALAGHSKRAPADTPPLTSVPNEVRAAVQGDILAVLPTGNGWLVYGGPGENRYDMSALAGVIDPDGNDHYTWAMGGQPDVQVIVDFLGDDSYGGAAQGGPAAACLGLSLLMDADGNDRYQGRLRSCGSGLYGVGILIDAGGNDVYHSEKWSIGSGFYGVGALLDLGGGNDIYQAADCSEGIGGPRGFGLLFDAGGQDLYRANGPTPSAYGTPAVYYGLSQGIGFGVRGYDTGGVGILADHGGNDRYEAGEFSQGGAYFWGLGILDDRDGNDLYYGNRYAQGFGVHQAAGALIDHQGDDTYWAMCAADQGSAWDIAVGLLLDLQGNDSYQAEGLAQGSASMQGIAWLIDLGGTDRYVGGPDSSQGQSLGNGYHFDRTGCLSWSVLLDAGGEFDFYSNDRPNGQIVTPGAPNQKSPADSGLHGLCIDAAETPDLAP